MSVAALWTAALIAAGFFIKSYASNTSTVSTYGTTVIKNLPGLSLIQENGLKVLIPLSIPFAMVLLVAGLMWRRRRAGRDLVGPTAWGAVVVLGILTFLSLLTIGPFVLPGTMLLLIACVVAKPSPAPGFN
jgi:hypothetical protein